VWCEQQHYERTCEHSADRDWIFAKKIRAFDLRMRGASASSSDDGSLVWQDELSPCGDGTGLRSAGASPISADGRKI
jgi:hypothetical protein